jgi:heat shock protein HslJ
MKKHLFLRFTLALGMALMAAACAGTPPGQPAAGFEGALGKDWKLTAILKEPGNTALDRADLEADGLGDAFTLRFDEERISGKGFPNRYFGPYSRGKGPALSIGKIAATLMAAFKELEALSETEYFGYLERAQSWAWGRDSPELHIHSTTPEGLKAILVFVP